MKIEYIGDRPESLSFHFWKWVHDHPYVTAYSVSCACVIVTLLCVIDWSK